MSIGKPSNKTLIGKFGEDKAAEYLLAKGLKIISRNYYGTHGELDIVAYDTKTDTIIFTEVKTRKNQNFGFASQSIGKDKLKSLVQTAQQYMFENPNESQIRFDVVEVYYKTDSGGKLAAAEINHTENAFWDLSEYL